MGNSLCGDKPPLDDVPPNKKYVTYEDLQRLTGQSYHQLLHSVSPGDQMTITQPQIDLLDSLRMTPSMCDLNTQHTIIEKKRMYELKRQKLLEQLRDLEDQEWQEIQDIHDQSNGLQESVGSFRFRQAPSKFQYHSEMQLETPHNRKLSLRKPKNFNIPYLDLMSEGSGAQNKTLDNYFGFNSPHSHSSSKVSQLKNTPPLEAEKKNESFHSFKECPTEEDKVSSQQLDDEDQLICPTEVENNALEEHHNSQRGDTESLNYYSHLLKKIEFIKFNQVNPSVVSSGQFQINKRLINELELKIGISFEFKALKKYMDKWIAEGIENDEGNWEVRKKDDLIHIWNRWEGSEFNSSAPVIRSEIQFPDVSDPQLIFDSMAWKRKEWDQSM